ncbi:ATP-dependent DNA helicase Q5 isoform X2 [Colletes latitarsis]|uniref:ATP-dependent DNA helicase Q5 isoform X2 n=1 Tax=Colletes latitarsis TaxID=2605962 RepID=UPI004035AF80
MVFCQENLETVMRSTFGFENFMNIIQKEAATAISKGSEYVCISMPPKFGRNLCFQLPIVSQQGKVSLVFSPNLSYNQKHVDFLRSKQINAHVLTARMYANKRNAIVKDLTSICPTIVLLYCTPDLIKYGYFQYLMFSLTSRRILSYIVFNEAHRLSEWGYDYTVNYQGLCLFENIYISIPKVVVTTTVTDKVLEDICKLLKLRTPKIFKIPVERINVHYDVWFLDMISCPFEHLKNFIIKALGTLNSSDQKMGLVYCREETMAELIKDKLNTLGISTLAYHHKLNNTARRSVENKWVSGDAKIIITTYNYGFIHKKPIRCLVYWTVPGNIAKYYRESAQMYMDDDGAYCRIYFSTEEYSSVKFVIENHRTIKNPEHIEKRLNEYNKFVSYCLLTKCRHTIIGEYFGYITQPCITDCDVCKNKGEVRNRLLKFIEHSENVKKIKYNIYDVNEDLIKKENIKDNKDRLEKSSENKCTVEITVKDIVAVGNDEKVIVQYDNEQKPTTQSLVGKCNFNLEMLSLKPCSFKNNVGKNSTGRTNSTQASRRSNLRRKPRIESLNSDGSVQKIKKKDRNSANDLCEAIGAFDTREQTKRKMRRSISMDTCSDELKPKRKKLKTENKPTSVTLIQKDREISDRDKRMKRIKDDANERVEHLMDKYKLNKDLITLTVRRK